MSRHRCIGDVLKHDQTYVHWRTCRNLTSRLPQSLTVSRAVDAQLQNILIQIYLISTLDVVAFIPLLCMQSCMQLRSDRNMSSHLSFVNIMLPTVHCQCPAML